MNKAPEVIEVPFEYDVKTTYYKLELQDFEIERVALEGILSFLQECNDKESVKISKWIPTEHGWKSDWRISGKEFYDKHKLVEIR